MCGWREGFSRIASRKTNQKGTTTEATDSSTTGVSFDSWRSSRSTEIKLDPDQCCGDEGSSHLAARPHSLSSFAIILH